MVVKWQFHDASLGETYTFDINPNDDGWPGYKKNFTYAKTTAPNGNVVMFEGRDDPRKGTFKGVLLYESQLNALVSWYQKRNQITVTDDLGRSFTIIIESFEATRRWTVSHPWKHDYSMGFIVVDWTG